MKIIIFLNERWLDVPGTVPRRRAAGQQGSRALPAPGMGNGGRAPADDFDADAPDPATVGTLARLAGSGFGEGGAADTMAPGS